MFSFRQVVHAFALLTLPAIASLAWAVDWPQWRGPTRDGLSPETGLLQDWPQEGPPLAWHAKDIGDGYSTPAVVGERLYLMSNKGTDDEFVLALNVADGKPVWKTTVGKVGPNEGPQYPGSRSTPTVDGNRLYALGSDGDLVCLSTEDGEAVWSKNLRQEFGGKPGRWAYSESPLVDGDQVVCTPGGSDTTIVALDKKNGDVIWKSQVPGGDEAAYSSIIVVDAGGLKQYVQFMQKGLVGVDAKTGKFLWRYDATAKGSPANIPTPVAQGGLVYSAAGRSGGGLVKLETKNGEVQADEVYFTPKLPTSIGGSVEVDGFLYGTNSGGLLCANFETGEIQWQERSVGAGAVCYADGRLYVHGENGNVALVVASSKEYREVGRFTPPDQPKRTGKAWAYPVVANGKLYLRDATSLWCYDVKQK